jgi:hypothetical protein
MLPKTHFIIGFIVSSIIFVVWPSIGLFNISIIFLSSFLIDFDHYLYFIWTTKDFSLLHAYNWFIAKGKFTRSLPQNKRKIYKHVILLFHGIEFWLVLFLVSFIDKVFLWMLLGVAIHMLADFIGIVYYQERFYTKLSQIYVCISNKNKKPLPQF